MSIDPKLLVSNFLVMMTALGLLIGGKTILVALVGRFFGVSMISTIQNVDFFYYNKKNITFS